MREIELGPVSSLASRHCVKLLAKRRNQMSLAIDVDTVTDVLLADRWHKVKGTSFALDAYEYMYQGEAVLGGGQVAGVPSTGAEWSEANGAHIACPVTAILAVKIKPKKKKLAPPS
jgi:hypothetical protein